MSEKILEQIANLKAERAWSNYSPDRVYLTEESAWGLFKALKDGGIVLTIEEKQEWHKIYIDRDTDQMKAMLDTSSVLDLKVTVVCGVEVV